MEMNKKPDSTKEEVRLHVFLANRGVGSRRQCEQYISQGLVKLNGRTQIQLGKKVKPGDLVEYKGRRISWSVEDKVYIALYKPEKYICSHQDSQERALAVNLVQPFFPQRLFYVGRLDYMTSGLLLLTNDGDFSKKLMHPSFEVEKEYEVKTSQEIPRELLERFKRGMWVKGERYQLKSYTLRGLREANLILTEGKNQEIRQVFLSQCISIKRIHRLRIGSLTLRGLAPGQFRKLTKSEISRLLNETKPAKMRIYQRKECVVRTLNATKTSRSSTSFNERNVYKDPNSLREKRGKRGKFKFDNDARKEQREFSDFRSPEKKLSFELKRNKKKSDQLSLNFAHEGEKYVRASKSRLPFGEKKKEERKQFSFLDKKNKYTSTKSRCLGMGETRENRPFKRGESSLSFSTPSTQRSFMRSASKSLDTKGGGIGNRHRRTSGRR